MKLTVKHSDPPPLWSWLSSRLPDGLVAYSRTDGYASTYGITIKERGMPSLLNRWFGESVAVVDDRRIEIQQPNWFSDFEELVRRYESEHGIETEVVICEAKVVIYEPPPETKGGR